jgi:hypothetical protein
MNMKKIIFGVIIINILLLAGIMWWWYTAQYQDVKNDNLGVACTMDAMQCPDGIYVGRTGPQCEFVCPSASDIPADIQAQITEKSNLITLTTPVPGGIIQNPLELSGQARGFWFFEASFPIVLTNWDGLIIAEGFATAQGDWMTEAFVPYTATIEFVNPYNVGDPDFMKSGTLILQRDNPSGLPENDDALEIPIRFAL